MSEATRQVGNAVFWSVFARTGRFILSLASGVIVVRGLGSHDYGVLSLVRTILTFSAIIAGAGLGQALLKFLPALRVSKDAQGAVRLVRRVAAVQALIWIVLVAATYYSRHALGQLFQFERFQALGEIICIAVALSLFELFFNLVAHILMAHYDTKRLSMAAIINHVIFIALLLVLIPAGGGVLGVLVAAAVGNLSSCVLLFSQTAGHFAAEGAGSPGPGIAGRRLFRFSLPFAAMGILNMIIWRQSETLFLAYYRSAVETGFFDLAYRLPQTMLEFVPGTVWPIIMAGFSEVYEKDASNLVIAIDKYYKVLFLLCAPICLFGITFGGKMIPILFGNEMVPAAVPTQVFFGIFTLSFFATPLSMSLYVMEKTHINLLIGTMLAALNIGLDIVLIPRFGVPGAILPVGLVIALSPFIYKRVLSRFLHDARIPYRYIGKCFLASLPVLLLFPIVLRVDNIFELAIAVAVGVFILIISFKKLRVLGSEEVDLLGSIPVANRVLRFMSS
ncbi:MAG: oligosaccharide flippase family protein [Candidatus Latescibacteria bacterium]|nr:oligosaccharide flippase family protein [Candidatus Latescibacterota bacterium]NIM20887.1 oligosaccharide flippase family protein [Candidatus Latescibacterota bacterium]NIM65022.1 oligosaccharide flippase family protein [Candidatus Latescibacterota bacterium]NIO01537.1 oligosaccharide flippase family protein [Candidatus Latescibacterota bacterium]NIO28054.1 oligosaccharide flippase family protein [Candidatus Latescibacterota bacterium]